MKKITDVHQNEPAATVPSTVELRRHPQTCAHARVPKGKNFVLLLAAAATLVAISAYAALPSRTVPPTGVAIGTLAGQTPVNVMSVDAFTRAILQGHGTNAVLQHQTFSPFQSTLWHTHPGPNIVLLVGGTMTLTDEHCKVTTYTDGHGFATGLNNHLAVAGPNGADFYSLYFLPADADVLRTPRAGVTADPPNCAQQ
jgi:quercetin dioxygenase-like cupin family protein